MKGLNIFHALQPVHPIQETKEEGGNGARAPMTAPAVEVDSLPDVEAAEKVGGQLDNDLVGSRIAVNNRTVHKLDFFALAALHTPSQHRRGVVNVRADALSTPPLLLGGASVVLALETNKGPDT